MQSYRWDEIEREQLNPNLARRVIHAERITIARLELRSGAVVPRHSHENEQVTLLESGRLKFVFDDREEIIAAGQVMRIAPNAPHSVETLEDSVVYDLFAPIRQDWLRGDDSYLRR